MTTPVICKSLNSVDTVDNVTELEAKEEKLLTEILDFIMAVMLS